MDLSVKGNKIGIIMGSISDYEVMKDVEEVLKKFDISYEINIVSAHRTPDDLYKYASTAIERGIKVIIAGAGGAAHLPGMVAAMTELPVIGVPVKSSSLNGIDSLLSIVQMPKGVPVATVAINGAANAGIIGVQILATSDEGLIEKLRAYKEELKTLVDAGREELLLGGGS
ncbi:MAG: 5-(carboxyamino)imidazole ribonucleotide mutase [Clostridium sp.]